MRFHGCEVARQSTRFALVARFLAVALPAITAAGAESLVAGQPPKPKAQVAGGEAKGSAAADPRAILRKALDADKNLPPMMMDIEVTQRYAHEEDGRHFRVNFRKSGEKLDVICHTSAFGDDGSVSDLYDDRLIWDGEKTLSRRVQGGKVQAVLIREKPSVAWRSHAPFLFGVLDYEETHYAELLLRSANLKGRPQQKAVDGHPCYVVEGDTPQGHYTVWLDPAADFRCRKARVWKLYDPPKPINAEQDFLFQTWEIDGVTITSSKGVFAITGATQVVTNVYGDGSTGRDMHKAAAKNVQCNPDFARVKAFRMDLPDGTMVREVGGTRRWVWSGGNLAPWAGLDPPGP